MTRVAINGFGRIGRNFLRAYLERRPNYEVVAVNDLGDLKTMAHLLEFDSLLGRLPEEVVVDADTITVGQHQLRAFSIPEPENLDLTYSMCGYGIVSRKRPGRCSMCHVNAAWMEPGSSPAPRAAAQGRFAG